MKTLKSSVIYVKITNSQICTRHFQAEVLNYHLSQYKVALSRLQYQILSKKLIVEFNHIVPYYLLTSLNSEWEWYFPLPVIILVLFLRALLLINLPGMNV